MDLNKTTVLLKKINRLHELINAIGEASSTEADLLKAYVIDLYEAVAMADIEEAKDLEIDEMRKMLKKRRKAEKKLKKSVNKKYKKVTEEVEAEIAETTNVEIEKVTAEPKTQNEEAIVTEPVPDERSSTKDNGSSLISQEIKDLFDIEEKPELSDKLANSPISDLTRAMGINEKIFTQKELFGGDQNEMDNILLAMNGLSNFDEAKAVMMNSVAVKYDWSAPSRIKKAKNFIKLVKRRYN